MTSATFPTNGTTNGHSTGASSADAAIDLLYSWMPPQTPPVPLYEAPASLNCVIVVDGRPCQITLRDSDELRLLARMAKVLRMYPDVPSPVGKKATVAAGETSDTGEAPQCPQHGAMRTGKRGFFCPAKVGDSYCTYTVQAK